jgi:hypothetical protein
MRIRVQFDNERDVFANPYAISVPSRSLSDASLHRIYAGHPDVDDLHIPQEDLASVAAAATLLGIELPAPVVREIKKVTSDTSNTNTSSAGFSKALSLAADVNDAFHNQRARCLVRIVPGSPLILPKQQVRLGSIEWQAKSPC